MTQCFAGSPTQLLQDPAIQWSIDPPSTRSAGIMGKSAGCHNCHFLRPIFEYASDRPAKLVTRSRRRHRREVGIHVKGNDRDIQPRRNFHYGSGESVTNPSFGPTERFELLSFRYVESLPIEFL